MNTVVEHTWEYCYCCEQDVVICGACGNNCCNGGYGNAPDGSVCPSCPSAYDLQDKWRAEDEHAAMEGGFRRGAILRIPKGHFDDLVTAIPSIKP